MNKHLKRIGLLMSAWMLGSGIAFAQTSLPISVNESKYMETGTITRVAVGNPDIADIRVLSQKDFLVVGKKQGSTTLLIWTADGNRQEYRVEVNGDDAGTAEAIQRAIGYPNVKVQMLNGNILLRGKVKDQYEHDTAVKVAKMYLNDNTSSSSSSSGEVVDLLNMTQPSQIRLEAMIIEVNTDDEKNLGINYWTPQLGNSDSTGVTPGASGLIYGGENFKNSRGSFGWIGSHISTINASLQALISNGKARILSRPSIATMSGQPASILIGGRIPVPVSGDSGQVSIDWREYGIRLNIEPTVDENNLITSKVHAEISTLDYSHGVVENNFNVPAIASREANAVINVRSGMTMAIGGLLNSEESKTVTKIPLLGDIPVLGQFFRHTSKKQDKRELIVLITPTLVSDNDPVPMGQRLKESYEYGRDTAGNRELVDVNAKKAPKDKKDLFGDTPKNEVVAQDEEELTPKKEAKEVSNKEIKKERDNRSYLPPSKRKFGAKKVEAKEEKENDTALTQDEEGKSDIRERVRRVLDGSPSRLS